MLIIRYPDLKTYLSEFPIGLWPLKLPDRDKPVLMAKVPKEHILTARERNGLKFYFSPMEIHGVRLIGLTTAFFDDEDEPLCIRTLLFGDGLSSDLLKITTEPNFEVYFFDEHNHELASFDAHAVDPAGLRAAIRGVDRSEFQREVIADAYRSLVQWFSQRNSGDDARAFSVEFRNSLFPNDIFTMDLDSSLGGYAGAHLISHHSLIQEDVGRYQEPAVLRALQRVFRNDQLFMNPMRVDKKGQEFSDALVLTDAYVIIVQAKDSPNTPKMLERDMSRKRAIGHGHLEKAQNQLRGAINHCKASGTLRVRIGEKLHELPVGNKIILGIVVVRELFPDEAERHLAIIKHIRDRTGADSIVLDYPGLAALTFHLDSEIRFTEACQALVDISKVNQYPEITTFLLNHLYQGQRE